MNSETEQILMDRVIEGCRNVRVSRKAQDGLKVWFEFVEPDGTGAEEGFCVAVRDQEEFDNLQFGRTYQFDLEPVNQP
jgi:hypothetical protein